MTNIKIGIKVLYSKIHWVIECRLVQYHKNVLVIILCVFLLKHCIRDFNVANNHMKHYTTEVN